MRRARSVTPISPKASLVHLRVRWYGVTPEVPQYSFSPLIVSDPSAFKTASFPRRSSRSRLHFIAAHANRDQ